MNAPAEARERQRFGKYLLVDRLGRGGMAEVWKARITGPAGFSRTLVVKRILPHLVEDPHFVQMFVDEARLSARLNHANIVQVFELGDVDGEYYLAMEYVRGRDLVDVVRAQLLRGLPAPGMGAMVVRELARALAYAHALTDEDGQPLRLIHRDVSPSNVMIGFDGAVKLLDFGIAKALAHANEHRTITGTLKGKFGYMSPEQVEGREIDHRADLFAVGVVLHEVLTGRRLFKGPSDMATINLVREARIEPPSLLNPAVPPELDRICLRALARRVEDRWSGCDQMAVALDEVTHQLKWGPERLVGLMRELFPDEPLHGADAPARSAESAGVMVRARPVRPRQRAWLAVGLAVLGGAAVAGGVAWKRRHAAHGGVVTLAPTGTATGPGVAVGAPPGEGGAGGQPMAAATDMVTVRVVSTPAGAEVYLGDERRPRGRTPVAFELVRGTQPERVTVRLRGFVAQTAEVTPDADSRLVLTLAHAPAPSTRPHPRPTKAEPAAAEPAAARPDLRKGDVVDPFAPHR